MSAIGKISALDYCTPERWHRVLEAIQFVQSVAVKRAILMGSINERIAFLVACMEENIAEAEDNVPNAVFLLKEVEVWVKDFVALAKDLQVDTAEIKSLEDSLAYHLEILAQKAKTEK